MTVSRNTGDALEGGILEALDGLLLALELESVGEDQFRAHSEPDRFGRVFGGQMLAQALEAACITVDDKPPHSMHAYFVQAGSPEQSIEVAVDRVRDGRSMAARREIRSCRITVSAIWSPIV